MKKCYYNTMDKFWNISVDFLAKVNNFIPLDAVLWAGVGVIGIALILAITGCALRKRLVPQWLIWSYFIFATIIIFAQANNDIFTVMANLEIPCLVVLVCYLLRLVFYRRPRYTYVERAVYSREIDKTPVVKNVAENTATSHEVEKPTLEEVKTEIKENEVVATEEVAEVAEEVAPVTTEAKTEENETAVVEENVEPAFVMPAMEDDEPIVEVKEKVEEEKTVVEPVVEEVKETPVVTPVAEPVSVKAKPVAPVEPVRPVTPVTPVRNTTTPLTSTTRTSTLYTPRTTTTTSTTATSRPASRPLSSFNSTLGANRTTTTSTTTTTVRPTTATGASKPAPRSTDEIMAAIERLRASMKK